jgi:UDP-GlcNAc:undecaprenyl-phosphate/decaprenyl-phosphate GlcNAc-1-phosphate transferase
VWFDFDLKSPWTYVYVFFVAFTLSVVLCHLLARLANRWGIVDIPGGHKTHRAATPLLGGVAIYVAFAVTMVSIHHYSYQMIGIVLGGLPVLLVGMWDDVAGKGVSGSVKFMTLICVTLLLEYFGVRVNLLHALADDYTTHAGILATCWVADSAITLLWIVGVTSALNGVDNMNGLASGLALIASFAFAAVAFTTPEYFMAMMAIGLVAANAGFLTLNFRVRARMFLGDSGSFFLGYALAAMGVLGQWSEHAFIAYTIPALILAVPIFDLTYTVLTRHVTGVTTTWREALSHCDTDHLSHRLVRVGLSRRIAVVCLWILAFSLGLGGVLLRCSINVLDSMLLIGQAILILGIIGVLLRGAVDKGAAAFERPVPVTGSRGSGVSGKPKDIGQLSYLSSVPSATEIELTASDKP